MRRRTHTKQKRRKKERERKREGTTSHDDAISVHFDLILYAADDRDIFQLLADKNADL